MPPIAVHWVKNSILAAIVSAVVSLSIAGVRHGTGAADADAGLGAILISYVASIGLLAFSGAANGVLAGAVLQRILPLLPTRTWIALQVVIAVVIGVGGMSLIGSPREPTGAQDVSMLLPMLLAGFILAAILGAGIGALEALVLRKVAFGTTAWIGCTAFGYAIAMTFVVGGARLLEIGPDLAGELTAQVLYLVASLMAALVMLPALRRLKAPLSSAPQYFT